jgi:hypothetical protein
LPLFKTLGREAAFLEQLPTFFATRRIWSAEIHYRFAAKRLFLEQFSAIMATRQIWSAGIYYRFAAKRLFLWTRSPGSMLFFTYANTESRSAANQSGNELPHSKCRLRIADWRTIIVQPSS